MTARLAQEQARAHLMSNYYDFLEEKMAPKPAYQRAMPKFAKPPQPQAREVPMTVEESTACEAIIERVNAYWRKWVLAGGPLARIVPASLFPAVANPGQFSDARRDGETMSIVGSRSRSASELSSNWNRKDRICI